MADEPTTEQEKPEPSFLKLAACGCAVVAFAFLAASVILAAGYSGH